MIDRPLHIVHVVAGVVEGGLSKHLGDLTRAQLAMGDRVSVIARPELRGALPEGAGFFEARLNLGRRDPRALLALSRALRRLAPDVIAAHASKATQMLALCRRLKLAPEAPIVATLHSVKRGVRAYEAMDGVIAVSPGAAELIARAPVSIVPNGVAAPSGPPPADPERARPLAIAVGRLVPVKGFDVLLEAWRGLDADLDLIGDGRERGRLEERAAERGLAGRVRFLGHREDAVGLLALADLVVIPSRREGFSYVMAEALLARRPIVATRVPGPRDYLPERCLAEPGDAGTLAERLRAAVGDLPGLTAAMKPAFDRARSELTLEAMAAGARAAYERAIIARSGEALA